MGDLGGLLLFGADDGAAGEEPWTSDGTNAGTARLADIYPGFSSSGPGEAVAAGGYLFFRATDPTAGDELWAIQPTCPSFLDLVDRKIIGDAHFEALDAVTLEATTLSNGAEVTVVSGDSVVLGNGFEVGSGSIFEVTIDPMADCHW